MSSTSSRQKLLPCDVKRQPQLPVISVLRSAAVAVVPALLNAHPAVAADRLSTSTERAADDVVRLAQRLRIALDTYRRALLDECPF